MPDNNGVITPFQQKVYSKFPRNLTKESSVSLSEAYIHPQVGQEQL
jgi:hypothetical protein